MKAARSLRFWALVTTGLGLVVVMAMLGLAVIADVLNLGVPILPFMIATGGCALAAAGLIVLVLDAVLRLTGRRF
ncbi:hypothetical protein ACT4S2_03280 [Kocuria turfanensis]|uniref:hypothetical protein n=1 Tax=Kocuria turfanensis TaxID=388357 RepID=UPI004036AEEB